MKELITRMYRKTPLFFKKLRAVGLTLAAVGAAIIAAPVQLPSILIQVAEYLTVAGAVVIAVSQTAVLQEKN